MKKPSVPPVLKLAQNKPLFDADCLTAVKDLDPNAPRFIEFDWEVLRRHLGEAREDLGQADYELMGKALKELLGWIVKGEKLSTIGRRAIALAWVVNPDIFQGASSAALARKVGVHRVTLAVDGAEASRKFKITNRAQCHNWRLKRDKAKQKGKK